MCSAAALAVVAVATLLSTVVTAEVSGHGQSSHSDELAIVRSTPPGKPDIIKA
jgi:hypothetical protein